MQTTLIRLTIGTLLVSKWYDAESVVEVDSVRAKELIDLGHATLHVSTAFKPEAKPVLKGEATAEVVKAKPKTKRKA